MSEVWSTLGTAATLRGEASPTKRTPPKKKPEVYIGPGQKKYGTSAGPGGKTVQN